MQTRSPPSTRTRGPLIVVFDSDEAITGLIVRILRHARYDAIAPPAISDVVPTLEIEPHTMALIIDPGISPQFLGMVVCRAARIIRPLISVILVGGEFEFADDPSVSAVLRHPIRVDGLLEMVRSLLGQSQDQPVAKA